jgi:hypothetical protein
MGKSTMSELRWLDNYSGQTVDELLSLEGEYRTDSLIVALHQAVEQKWAREGDDSLSMEERMIPAIQALEREVNNGGYEQFFINSSNEYASMIVEALVRIECLRTAEITQSAIDALHLSSLTVETISAAMASGNADVDAMSECDNSYFNSGEDIGGRLFSFIKRNKDAIRL